MLGGSLSPSACRWGALAGLVVSGRPDNRHPASCSGTGETIFSLARKKLVPQVRAYLSAMDGLQPALSFMPVTLAERSRCFTISVEARTVATPTLAAVDRIW
jgi:hypothetical protein